MSGCLSDAVLYTEKQRLRCFLVVCDFYIHRFCCFSVSFSVVWRMELEAILRQYLWLWVILGTVFVSVVISVIFILINKCICKQGRLKLQHICQGFMVVKSFACNNKTFYFFFFCSCTFPVLLHLLKCDTNASKQSENVLLMVNAYSASKDCLNQLKCKLNVQKTLKTV